MLTGALDAARRPNSTRGVCNRQPVATAHLEVCCQEPLLERTGSAAFLWYEVTSTPQHHLILHLDDCTQSQGFTPRLPPTGLNADRWSGIISVNAEQTKMALHMYVVHHSTRLCWWEGTLPLEGQWRPCAPTNVGARMLAQVKIHQHWRLHFSSARTAHDHPLLRAGWPACWPINHVVSQGRALPGPNSLSVSRSMGSVELLG